jgi:hypothetical protein
MPAGPAFRVVVTTPGGNILIEPEKLTVDRVGTGEPIAVVWTALGGSTFPETGFFTWKGTNPGPVVRLSDTEIVLTYIAPANPIAWAYGMCAIPPGGSTPSCVDPEIDNVRPGPGAGKPEKPEKPEKPDK